MLVPRYQFRWYSLSTISSLCILSLGIECFSIDWAWSFCHMYHFSYQPLHLCITELKFEGVFGKRIWANPFIGEQVRNVKKAVVSGKESNGLSTSSVDGMRRELMRLPNPHQTDRSNQYRTQDNDELISSESDRQLLLIKWSLLPSLWIMLRITFYWIRIFLFFSFSPLPSPHPPPPPPPSPPPPPARPNLLLFYHPT